MIDNVRSTVLYMLKKENKGWITPEQFNRFADIAQLEIFEDYFYEYNRWLTKTKQRMVFGGIADLPELILEKIEHFLVFDDMTYANSVFSPPSNCYRLESVYNGSTIIDKIKEDKIGFLLKSNLTSPTTSRPIYIQIGKNIQVYPDSIITGVKCYYIRKPLTPKWTYTSVLNNPVFDNTKTDYQDFEIHPSDEPKLVVKILSKSGLSIREAEVVEYIEREEQIDTQLKNN